MKYRRIVAWIGDGLLLDFDQADRHDFYIDFGYSFPLFSSLLKKDGRRKGE